MRAKNVLRCLGEELRDRRKQMSLSQEALAHEAGVHVNVVGRLERGTYNPTVLVLYAITSKLGLSLAELFVNAGRRQQAR